MSLLPQVDVLLAFAVIILVGCLSVAAHDFIERRWPVIVRWVRLLKRRWAR